MTFFAGISVFPASLAFHAKVPNTVDIARRPARGTIQPFLIRCGLSLLPGQTLAPFIDRSGIRIDRFVLHTDRSPWGQAYSKHEFYTHSRANFIFLLLNLLYQSSHLLPHPLGTPLLGRTMARTPPLNHRPQGQFYRPSRHRPPYQVRYATTMDATDLPEAGKPREESIQSRHSLMIRSQISGSDRVFIGNAEPSDEMRNQCEKRLHIAKQEHKREVNDVHDKMLHEIHKLHREMDRLRYELADANRERELQRISRRRILYREIIVSVYIALGHNQNNPRTTTFDYLRIRPSILQEAFDIEPEDITDVLNALNPRKSQSWINLGNAAAHEFTIGEAWCLAEDPTIRRLLHALTSQVGNTVPYRMQPLPSAPSLVHACRL